MKLRLLAMILVRCPYRIRDGTLKMAPLSTERFFRKKAVRRSNETGNIYESDIRDLQERLEEIWTDMKEVLVRLSSIQ